MTTPLPKRVLVVCWSQTGQLTRCVERFLAPLRRREGVQVDVVSPEPAADYPFPWPFTRFVDAMPESVLQVAPPMKPLRLPAERYDLVVLGYQVWYLSPALPVVGFLQSEAAAVLKDTPVVALCACRNMWHAAWLKLKALVEARGGKIIDHVVRIDQGPTWATFFTTPRWLWTGRKEAFGPFPAAGISDADIASLEPLGEQLADAVVQGRLQGPALRGPDALEVNKRYVMPEFLASHVFPLWAKAIRAVGRLSPRLRVPVAVLFIVWLMATVATLLPLLVLAGVLVRTVFRGWFRARLETLAAPSGGLPA